jgi:ubiquinone biosynthesis monooxygenase Coq7
MKEDEAKHAKMAQEAGARELPAPIRHAMAVTADIMKSLAYRI